MKRTTVLLAILIVLAGCSACGEGRANTSDADVRDRPEKIHEDIAAETIHHVNISGDARSIVIRQSADQCFEFYNGDLNPAHTYEVSCKENDGTLDISIMMENPESDNDVLGSVLIDIPQKEFEEIEITGGFSQISLYTLNSDVLIQGNGSFVYLDLEADRLEHDITLDGSGASAFRGVSLYLDRFPDHVKMELNLMQGGAINDPEGVLEKNGLASGSGEPVISINGTKEINIYKIE